MSSQQSRLDEIGRTLRHAQATRSTETDSWLNGYQDDVAYLFEQLENQRPFRLYARLTELEEQLETRDVEVGRLRDALIDIATMSEAKGGHAKYGTVARAALYPANSSTSPLDAEGGDPMWDPAWALDHPSNPARELS